MTFNKVYLRVKAEMLGCFDMIPVNSHIVTSFVSDFDNQSVSIVDFQRWARVLPIHGDAVVGFAQPLHWSCFNLFHYNQQLGNYYLTEKS